MAIIFPITDLKIFTDPTNEKGPWGPELIWYLATKCKMGRQQVVPAVYHHLKHDKWGVADLTWQSYIPLDLK